MLLDSMQNTQNAMTALHSLCGSPSACANTTGASTSRFFTHWWGRIASSSAGMGRDYGSVLVECPLTAREIHRRSGLRWILGPL
jgi:hypothetical protein